VIVALPLSLACGVLVLSGCSDDGGAGEPSDEPTAIEMPVSGSTLLVGGPVDEVEEERITGKPVFVNGCLGAQSGTTTFLVVWPSGTSLDRNDADSLRFGDQVLDPGGSFVGRGTFVNAQPFPTQFPEIPLSCLGPNQEKIAWVQEVDEVNE
jgi:hypothetical protein